MKLRALLALIAGALLLTACDESFTPFAPGAHAFTVYGTLDAGADTQWIRVELLRTTLATSAEPSEAIVTLQELGTGRTIALRERVGRLSTALGTSTYVHNFWTDERIRPATSYRFLARHTGADSAFALVTTPPDYGVAVFFGQYWRPGDQLRLGGVKRAPFLTQTVFFDDSCGTSTERKSIVAPVAKSDTILLGLTPLVPGARACRPPVVARRELWIVGTQGDWPGPDDYSTVRPGASQEPSNVSNAMGFLGAVFTKRVPYESCQYASRPASDEVCVLRYDSLAATVKGTAFDMWCPDSVEGYRFLPDTLRSGFGIYARVPRVAVTLRELTPRAGMPPRVRVTSTDRLGTFSVGALEAGRYAVSFFRDEIPAGDIIEYLPVTDTVTIAQRQQLSLAVPLVGQVACWQHPRFQ